MGVFMDFLLFHYWSPRDKFISVTSMPGQNVGSTPHSWRGFKVCTNCRGGEVVNGHVSVSLAIKEFAVRVCVMCYVCVTWWFAVYGGGWEDCKGSYRIGLIGFPLLEFCHLAQHGALEDSRVAMQAAVTLWIYSNNLHSGSANKSILFTEYEDTLPDIQANFFIYPNIVNVKNSLTGLYNQYSRQHCL